MTGEGKAALAVYIVVALLVGFLITFILAPRGFMSRLISSRPYVPGGFKLSPGTGEEPYTNTGWAKEVIHKKTGIEMVFIPAGEFMMGSPDSEADRDSNEGPVHRVQITRPFYLGKYEVTQGEWEKIAKASQSRFQFQGGERYPMESITWHSCKDFTEKAGDGLRLPTEAEWEYACRAGTKTRFSFGDSASELADYAWYDGNSGNELHPVGQKKPNAWGLYDMHGNVWELCASWYGDSYDPRGPASTAYVMRGGSWCDNARYCRSARRDCVGSLFMGDFIGLRVALGL